MKSWMVPVVLLSTLVVTGCDSGEDLGDDAVVQERTLPGFTDEFWTWFPWREANGDLEIHRGTSTAVEECLIFDFGGGSLEVQSTATDADGNPIPGDGSFELVAMESDNNIIDPNGNLLCSAEMGDQVGTFKLRSADGTVLYTLFGDLVFDGDVQIPWRYSAFQALVRDYLAFHFEDSQVYDGIAWSPDSEVLVTATAEIERANPMRQLVITAFVDGQCGSPGYDAYPVPPQ